MFFADAACFSPPSKITYSMTRSYTQKLNSLNASLDLQIDRLQAINRSMRDVFSFPATTMTNNQSAAHNSDSNDEDEDIIMNEGIENNFFFLIFPIIFFFCLTISRSSNMCLKEDLSFFLILMASKTKKQKTNKNCMNIQIIFKKKLFHLFSQSIFLFFKM